MTITGYESSTDSNHAGGALRIGEDWGTGYTTSPKTVTLENIKFWDNASNASNGNGNGGAILVVNNAATSNHVITINECLFYDNRAQGSNAMGGAIYAYDNYNITINNSVFVDNYAQHLGGVIYAGDGTYDSNTDPSVTINNCTMYRNWANTSWSTNAGAIRAFNANANDELTINVNNSIIYNNIRGTYLTYPDWSNNSNAVATLYYLGYDMGVGNSGNYTTFNIDNSSYNYNTANVEVPTHSSASWPGIGGSNKEMWPTAAADGTGSIDEKDGAMSILADESTVTNKDVDGVDRPQGLKVEIGAYEYRNTWTGAASSDWTAAGNWSFGVAPDNSSTNNAPIVTSAGNSPIISGSVELDHLLIRSGTLTIAATGDLKLTGNLINNGTLNMESNSAQFSSLIVQGESYGMKIYNDLGNNQTSSPSIADDYSGNITYKRYVRK